MKINKLLLISFFAMAQYSFGQVKIGNDINTIDSASILELESTDKVLILTRVTNTQMNAITPLTGAMVYNTDEGCMFQYNGILWQSLCNTSSFNQLTPLFLIIMTVRFHTQTKTILLLLLQKHNYQTTEMVHLAL